MKKKHLKTLVKSLRKSCAMQADEKEDCKKELVQAHEKLVLALATIYYVRDWSASVTVAEVCDEKIDRSGKLLGEVRQMAEKLLLEQKP